MCPNPIIKVFSRSFIVIPAKDMTAYFKGTNGTKEGVTKRKRGEGFFSIINTLEILKKTAGSLEELISNFMVLHIFRC